MNEHIKDKKKTVAGKMSKFESITGQKFHKSKWSKAAKAAEHLGKLAKKPGLPF